MTKDQALQYFDSKHQTFRGVNAGDYIDREDFETFAQTLPEAPFNVQGVEELKVWPFNGYAPGKYMNTCAVCSIKMQNVDKLCFVCLECAIKGAQEFLNKQIITNQTAKEYADKSYPPRDRSTFESDYDFQSYNDKHQQIMLHFIAGSQSVDVSGVLRECDEYLSQHIFEKGKPVYLNNIGANSILHRKIKQALSNYQSTTQKGEFKKDEKEIWKESVAEVLKESGGYWHSCSGCHETVDGQETGHYPHSDIFKCFIGSGCHECGGIGIVWDDLREYPEPSYKLPGHDETIDNLNKLTHE